MLRNGMANHLLKYIFINTLGILKVHPTDQRLFNKNNDVMNDEKQLQDYGITISTARAQSPAQLGLALR